MKMGQPLSPVRLPALVNGQVLSLNLGTLKGQWSVLCCLPHLNFLDVLFLDKHTRAFGEQGFSFFGLLTSTHPFHEPWVSKTSHLSPIILADSLGKVSRMLGVTMPRNGRECESVILDSDGIIRSYVVHALNGRDLPFVLEVLRFSKLIIGETPYQLPVGCVQPEDGETVLRSETYRIEYQRLRGISG